ncbi:hypothetical protein C9439_03935 [archaeon SCG-AAA382B04]|nr:hypothetical protein C9439_03935 [archaeon SCG-AAA382B04]
MADLGNKILDFVKSGEKRAKEIVNFFSDEASERTIKRHLKKLVEQKRLEKKSGQGREVYYSKTEISIPDHLDSKKEADEEEANELIEKIEKALENNSISLGLLFSEFDSFCGNNKNILFNDKIENKFIEIFDEVIEKYKNSNSRSRLSYVSFFTATDHLLKNSLKGRGHKNLKKDLNKRLPQLKEVCLNKEITLLSDSIDIVDIGQGEPDSIFSIILHLRPEEARKIFPKLIKDRDINTELLLSHSQILYSLSDETGRLKKQIKEKIRNSNEEEKKRLNNFWKSFETQVLDIQ